MKRVALTGRLARASNRRPGRTITAWILVLLASRLPVRSSRARMLAIAARG